MTHATLIEKIRALASAGMSWGLLADDYCSQIVALIDASPAIEAARASSQIAGDKLVRPRIDEIGLTPQCPAMSMTNGAKND